MFVRRQFHLRIADMNLTTTSVFLEERLSALNAQADARAIEDASDWDEAIDWGVPGL
jgi:hypothetical protein